MEIEYFGEPWPSGICDEGVRVDTPLGQLCVFCQEAIEEGDRGNFMTEVDLDMTARVVPVHRECSLRQVFGSYAHLIGPPHSIGECNEWLDELELTPRQDALLVWDWVMEHGAKAAVGSNHYD